MEISNSTKTALIRKGNEFFNVGKTDEAYRCYITASYFTGLERIADFYNYDKKEYIKAYRIYKMIMKEDSNLGGNIRVKEKKDEVAKYFANAIRKWYKEDSTVGEYKNNKNYYARVHDDLDKDKFHTR